MQTSRGVASSFTTAFTAARLVAAALGCTAVVVVSGCSAPPGSEGSPAASEGSTAVWELLDAAEVTPDSTALRLGVTRLECASGETGTVLEPDVQFERGRIVIRTDVEPLTGDAYNCQGNDAVPADVELSEPVGNRDLVDAACLGGEAVETVFCEDGPVRWSP
ncbi:hypothetical protein ACMX2H_01555 [Arthrobacter sulfonylureivorans]|uniref:hypothetical protein n=1 Tax=Arthrobacter sulfonylureivorans TaxID=2486855 RepID=UPI0039E33B75